MPNRVLKLVLVTHGILNSHSARSSQPLEEGAQYRDERAVCFVPARYLALLGWFGRVGDAVSRIGLCIG